MKSMKAYMPILLLGLLTFMTGTVAAQDYQLSISPSWIGWYNPCISGSVAVVSGTTNVDYQQNSSHEVVHVQFQGAGQDYLVNFEANAQFDLTAIPDSFGVPFHSVWVGQGSVPNFTMDGTVLVSMDQTSGLPIGSHVTPDGLQTSCTN